MQVGVIQAIRTHSQPILSKLVFVERCNMIVYVLDPAETTWCSAKITPLPAQKPPTKPHVADASTLENSGQQRWRRAESTLASGANGSGVESLARYKVKFNKFNKKARYYIEPFCFENYPHFSLSRSAIIIFLKKVIDKIIYDSDIEYK